MYDEPYPVVKGRTRYVDRGYELTMRIPSYTNVGFVFFGPFWLIGCGVFIGFQIAGWRESFSLFESFFVLWFFVGGCYVTYMVLWTFFGKELITLNSVSLDIETHLLLYKKKKRYDISMVRNLRVIEARDKSKSSFFNGFGEAPDGRKRGRIGFDYGLKTVKFGDRLDTEEAIKVIELMQKHLPRFQS